MLENNIPIEKSVFSEEFSDINSFEIYLLNKGNASYVWNTYIDRDSSSYFSLSNDSWIAKSIRTSIGEWIDDFNNSGSTHVLNILSSSISWDESDIVYFCISRHFIISSTWSVFKKTWPKFIECGDDCPILINSKTKKDTIIFSPIGNIIRLD